MYKKILKFREEGVDSGFFPSPTNPESFFGALVLGLVTTLFFSIGTDELVSFADGLLSELDLSTDLIMSISTFAMSS